MTQNEDSSARRWTRGRITLAISLALNLLVVGVVAGALLSGGGPGRYSANDPDSRRGPLREIGNAPFVRALEPADRQALLRALRDDGGTLRENRAELRRRFQALVAALESRSIEAALLDVTTPEPLPQDHPLWSLDNARITMHLSGRAQTRMFQRSVDRFVENLARWQRGEPVTPQMDLTLGY